MCEGGSEAVSESACVPGLSIVGPLTLHWSLTFNLGTCELNILARRLKYKHYSLARLLTHWQVR